MQAHEIKFPRTAHYYTIGTPSKQIQRCIFVLHGYGQLASQIIHKFDAVDSETFVVAPEGFSRFYWNEQKGIVGASWMTKQDRLSEISDYCQYLDHLYQYFVPQLSPDVEVVIIGFSQGGATTMRWVAHSQIEVAKIVLWGAAFPTDLPYGEFKSYLDQRQLYAIYGDQDEYISAERLAAHQEFLDAQQLTVQVQQFEGKHVLDRTTLYTLLDSWSVK